VLHIFHRRLASGKLTTRYPEAAEQAPPAFRGMPDLTATRCSGGGQCAAACPSAALHVQDQADGWIWRLDRAACTGCGLCVEACPNGALATSLEFELAARTRADLVTTVRVRASVPEAGR
jgi:formate hydrogenlyase subunit 6